MMWLTWRQLRVQSVTAAAALAVFAVLLAVTGPHLASMYSASGIAGCHGGSCAGAATRFLGRLAGTSPYPVVYDIGIGLILAAPAITGILWGAPLITREFEGRTFALAWTQSITRTRWIAVKLTLGGLAAMAVTEALSLLYGWWAEPIGRAISAAGSQSWQLPGSFSMHQFSTVIFATHGITPIGYAAFGFALGTAAGALIRRTVPAIAVTLVIFAAIQVAMPLGIRPHLIPPARTVVTGPSWFQATSASAGTLEATDVPGQPGAWLISSGAINAAGRHVSTVPAACLTAPQGKPVFSGRCLAAHGIAEAITYQPASRYWPLQQIETGIFLALALALAGLCLGRLRQRRT